MPNLSEYKQRFIDLLERRKELNEEKEALYKRIEWLENDINDNLKDIDFVFEDMQKNDYLYYESLTNNCNNSVCARYVHEGDLVEIERNMIYNNLSSRIKIEIKNIL